MADTTEAELGAMFAAQKQAFAREPYAPLAVRRERLAALRAMLVANRRHIRDAVAQDFGARHADITDLFETGSVMGRIDHTLAHLEAWMAPEPRALDASIHGASSASVIAQPKGVCGNISPWNFPIDSALVMVADMLGAGNRVICKVSEFTPVTSDLVRTMAGDYFAKDVLAVTTGGPEFGAHFATLPWNHLTFTGSPRVGRLVMMAAAANMVPVTLELGGKNPALFADDALDDEMVERFLFFRSFNAGQVCTSPDYALVPQQRLGEFVERAKRAWRAFYPSYVGHPDANGIISQKHFERLLGLIEEARARGVEIVPLNDDRPDAQRRQISMTLIVDPPDDLACQQEEIFGPVIPVVPYRTVDEAIARINANPSPLSAYIVTRDQALGQRFAREVLSGGAGINTFGFQAIEPGLPFGGVGRSGVGCHSGIEGFRNYSHMKTVFNQSDDNPLSALMRPPFGDAVREIADSLFVPNV